jgi:hypothetical protein
MFTVLSNTRNSNLYLIAALAIIIVALLTLAITPSISLHSAVAIPITGAQDSHLDFRRGEWTTGASAYQAYLAQRYGEQHQGKVLSAEAAYLEQRHGEQTIDRNDTYLPLPPGKQALIDASQKAYLEFRRGEWSGK